MAWKGERENVVLERGIFLSVFGGGKRGGGNCNERTSIRREDGSVAGGEVKGAGVASADEDGSSSGAGLEKEPFLGLDDGGQHRASLC